MKPWIMDREKIHFNLAKLKKGGEVFEIVIDPDLAMEFRNGKDIDMRDILKAEKIFSDPRQGIVASEHTLKNLFGTSDPLEVAKTIIKEGEIQATAEHRDKLRAEKRKTIVNMIATNAIDPKTKLPHPPQRIESALDELKIKIDEYKSAENQMGEIVSKLRTVLPISFEVKKIYIKVPSQYAGKCASVIHQFKKPLKEDWLGDGSYSCAVELPAGLAADFLDKLNHLTHGDIETKNL